MDHILSSLEKISELSQEELVELKGQIVDEFNAADSESETNLNPENVAKLKELGAAMKTVEAEEAGREAAQKELAQERELAVAQVRGTEAADNSADEDDDEDDEDEKKKKDEEESGKPFAADETPAAEAVISEEPAAEAAVAETPAEEVKSEELAVETPVEAEAAVVEEASTEEAKPEAEAAVEEAAEPADTPETEASVEVAETAETNPAVETELSVEETAPEAAAEGDGVEETELSTRKDSEADMSVSEENQSPLQAPDSHQPQAAEGDDVARAVVSITAGGDINGVSMGADLPDMKAVASAFHKRLHDIRRSTGGDGEQFTVATIHHDYPEERQLFSGDVDNNNAKIEAVTSPEAIVAAGGFCAPVEVSYDIFGFGVTDRPVKNSLASFQADRGGIRYTTSPVLGDLDAAVSTWTLQDDIDAATPGNPDPTKPCLRVDCGDEIVVHVDAIPLCLTFGNLQSRAFPELVERNNELALITQARYAEVRLLTRIGALSTQVSAPQKLGASRDFFVQIDQAAAGYRSRHRLDPDESLRVILPAWFKNQVRADITRSMPAGDDTDRFGIADNIVDSWFTARHINVTWHLDGEAANAGQAAQIFGAQTAGALNSFPAQVVWYLFSEGTFLFLDGGTLDLGLVRDSGLNATNDYKMFVETFEGVAKVGIESLRIVSTLKINGASAGTVDPATL